jgi:hypothetical protein
MGNGVVRLKQRGFGQTLRTDLWWIQPLAVFLGFGVFLVYAHFRVFEGDLYYVDAGGANYLTPFYSPLLFDQPGHHSGHAFLKEKPSWIPGWISPAAFILLFPAGFRFTCYYYRGAYYKAFWADPPNCAVGEPRKSYLGEHSLPLIIQNIHRYFLYAALIFIFILSYDVWLALWFRRPDGSWTMGIGLGTLILAVNVVLIALYTCGCHSLRHLIGGWRDELSKSPASMKAYNCVSCLNQRHMLWAWCSLVSVMFADLYVRQCASGAWTDWRIL